MKNMPRTPDGKVDLKAPPRRTADGKIDLSGFWMPTDRVKHLLNLAADLKPEDVPLQPWAEAVYKERIETNGKDHPGVRCWPSGIPEKLNIPDGLKLVQTPDLMLFLHESRTIYRQVFTDGAAAAEGCAADVDGLFRRPMGRRHVRRRDHRPERQDVARHAWAARHRSAARDRAVHPAHDRAHRHRRDDRRPEGLHEAVDRQAVLGPAARHRPDREHLRGEQQGPAAHGRQVDDPVEPANARNNRLALFSHRCDAGRDRSSSRLCTGRTSGSRH